MNITLLGQGFEAESKDSVGHQLIKFFADKNFHTFTGISAFASEAGVIGLSKHIEPARKNLKIITIVTGVDQKGTSKEALEALLNLEVEVFVFYHSAFPIFHPKIYLFEGKDKTELIIGSSNLTAQGLFTNVETSLLVSIDNGLAADRKIVDQLKDYFKGIFDQTDPNLKKLSQELIVQLVEAKVVPTEEQRKAAHDKEEKTEGTETDKIISKIFPKRDIAKIPGEFRRSKKTTTKVKATITVDSGSTERGRLVWVSGKLTERPLNIPQGDNTNPTGSMYFTKGEMEDIDQRHYFRDEVFSSLEWKKDNNRNTSHLERASAIFNLIIDGENHGAFELTITHNPLTTTASYRQKNSMTQVSWGEATKFIARRELIGKTARLFQTVGKRNAFTLTID